MTTPPKAGKSLVNDKATLLQLANAIADRTEHVTQNKVDKTRAAISSALLSKKKSADSTLKRNISTPSDRLRAAKQLVAARKAKQKREKTRARKVSDGQTVNNHPGPTGDGPLNKPSSPISTKRKTRTKQVAFV